MPVLLLAHGDPQAKDMLRKAIEGRYGARPPALDSLKIDFKGRARAKIGPVTTWVPVDATAYFRFPTAMRWDFNVKPFGLSVQKGIEAFDGNAYRTVRGGRRAVVINDTEHIHAMRRRLWAIAAVLLTPLGDHFVRLALNDETSFVATNTQIDDSVTIFVRPDSTVDYVEVSAIDPNNTPRLYLVRLSQDNISLNDLILPSKISTFWGEEPDFEIEPVASESNPQIEDHTFTLEE